MEIYRVALTLFFCCGRYPQLVSQKLELQNNFWRNKLKTARVGPARKSQNIRESFFCVI